MQDFTSLVETIRAALDNGAAIFICGNGGSATQADHFAGELVCSGIPCISLTSVSTITAIANDSDYALVFSKQLATLAKRGDVLIALTTSCKSKNIHYALLLARQKGMITAGFTGNKTLQNCMYQIKLRGDTQEIQEATLHFLHKLWRELSDGFNK